MCCHSWLRIKKRRSNWKTGLWAMITGKSWMNSIGCWINKGRIGMRSRSMIRTLTSLKQLPRIPRSLRRSKSSLTCLTRNHLMKGRVILLRLWNSKLNSSVRLISYLEAFKSAAGTWTWRATISQVSVSSYLIAIKWKEPQVGASFLALSRQLIWNRHILSIRRSLLR